MGDFFGLGPSEILLIGVIAVLLFGKNLPDVGRKAGKYLSDFRKSVQNIQREIHSATNVDVPSQASSSSTGVSGTVSTDREEATAPKFEPPPA